MTVVTLRRSHVLHLIHTPTLRAPLNRAIPARRQPNHHVAVGGTARAAEVLLVAEGLDDDGLVEGAAARGVERLHVEDVDALHFAEDFEALETGGLLEVGGDGAGWGARGEEVVLGGDFCGAMSAGARREECRGGAWQRWGCAPLQYLPPAARSVCMPGVGSRHTLERLHVLALLTRLWVAVRTRSLNYYTVSALSSAHPHCHPMRPLSAPMLPHSVGLAGPNSHLLTELTKPLAGATGRALTAARLARVVTARRANMLGGDVLCGQYAVQYPGNLRARGEALA